MNQLVIGLCVTVLVLSIVVILLLRSESAHKKLQNRRKLLVCRMRQKMQEDINEHRSIIRFSIIGTPEGPIKNFESWMTGKVCIPATQSKERKLIRITVTSSVYIGTNIVRVTIEWWNGKVYDEFLWTKERQFSCDISMRKFVLRNLKIIFSRMPNEHTARLQKESEDRLIATTVLSPRPKP